MGHGQVYLCQSGFYDATDQWHDDPRFRGILMDARGREVWVGEPRMSAQDAFCDMKEAAGGWAITDLRPWSGSL